MMNSNIINGEIEFRYPDDFRLMDSEELKKHFGTSNNMLGIRSAEQHIVMSFAWNKMNMLLLMLTDQKSVLNGMEKRLRDHLEGFNRTSDIAVNVCGAKANGFTFEYTANNTDIAQVGNLLSFKRGKYLYIIQFAARKEHQQESQNVFDEILSSMTLNKH